MANKDIIETPMSIKRSKFQIDAASNNFADNVRNLNSGGGHSEHHVVP